MKRKSSILLAAALVAGGLTFVPTFAEDADAPAAQEGQKEAAAAPQPPAFPAGVKADDDPAEERAALFDTLGDATEAVLTKDGFDDFVERLVDQDRNRIGADGFAEREFADLDAKARAIRAAWNAKYGADEFDADEEQAFAKLGVVVGKIDDARALATAWPVPAVTDPAGAAPGEPVPASATETAGNEDPDLDSNLEKGRGVAIATIPASHGLPALNVSFIHEVPGWRVDVPNALTGQQLHDGLLKHLTHVADAQADWPADKNEAALMIAHHVLLGAYGVDVEPSDAKDASSDDAPAATPAK
jgi:hypothetical protein